MSETELAWAAGFFDGEGSSTLDRPARAFRISIGQKEPTVLERFVAAIGEGRVYTTERPEYPWYTVAVTGVRAVRALERLWPYLSEPKKRQAQGQLAVVREMRTSLSRRVQKVEAAYDTLEGLPY